MNKIIFGDCRESMRQLVSDGVKVQMCVTSPPYYGLRDYGHADQLGLEETPEQYIANMVEVFHLVKDLLADDGVLWLNIGDSYARTGESNVPQTKKGGAKHYPNHNKGENNADNSGVLLHGGEPLLPNRVSNKPLQNVKLKPKDLIGIPWMLAFALRADGWFLRQDIIWHKPNPMPESVTDRCTKAHEYIFLLSKSQKYYFDAGAIREDSVTQHMPGQRITDTRTTHGTGGGNTGIAAAMEKMKNGELVGRNKRSVWTVNTKPYSGAHFAVFPEELIEPCVLAGSRTTDIVFDPFMGSGTTAQVAQKLGRQYLGCELNPEYEALQNNRTAQMGLVL